MKVQRLQRTKQGKFRHIVMNVRTSLTYACHVFRKHIPIEFFMNFIFEQNKLKLDYETQEFFFQLGVS